MAREETRYGRKETATNHVSGSRPSFELRPKTGPHVWLTISSWQPEVSRRQRFEIVIGELGVRGPRDSRLGHSPLVVFLSQPSTVSYLLSLISVQFLRPLLSNRPRGAESSLRPTTDKAKAVVSALEAPYQVLSATESCSLSILCTVRRCALTLVVRT